MLSTGVTPYPVDIRLYPVDTILISIRGVDSVHIPWTTHILWVISRGQHVISSGQHVISSGYAPWTTLLPWVTSVENTYPVGTISRGLHVPTGYKGLSTGYDIPWVISRGFNKFNRCLTNKPRREGCLHKVVRFLTCLTAEFLSCMCDTHHSNLNLYQF